MSERWIKRVFVIKDAFLCYYNEDKVPTSWFDCKPKVPLCGWELPEWVAALVLSPFSSLWLIPSGFI